MTPRTPILGSMPGVGVFLFNDTTLVGGAVVHPVPATLVKSMGADIVIAVIRRKLNE